MKYNTHARGQLVRVRGTFRDPENANAVIDPSVVKLSIKNPAGTVTTYTYGTGDTIVKDSTGKYKAEIDANAAGEWHYRWWSTGTAQAAEEGKFQVSEAEAV
jgi:hypothetical protein